MVDSSWFVYMVRNAKGDLYTGITTDLDRRLQEHRSGASKGAKALRGKGPLTMVWTQSAENRSQASKLESHIKRLTKHAKERLVAGMQVVENEMS